jgi:hypothetical protein
MSDANHAIRQTTDDHRSRPDHAQFTNGHVWADKDIRAHPGVFTDHYGTGDEGMLQRE